MGLNKAWYIRRDPEAAIKGPFPAGQISQELLLGRYTVESEVSHDKENWQRLRDVAELIPEIFTQSRDEPWFRERLAAARRWADERGGVDYEVKKERRHGESYEDDEIRRLHRLAKKAQGKNHPFAIAVQLMAIMLVVIFVIFMAFRFSPQEKNLVDCKAKAAVGINWSGCNLSGASLASQNLISANLMNTNLQAARLDGSVLTGANMKYVRLHLASMVNVNMSQAELKGANLSDANLSSANFYNADLRYANFKGASINDASFTGARLDHAIWLDGRTCAENSIGQCNFNNQ